MTNDLMGFLLPPKDWKKLDSIKTVPYAFIGYTRFFETGNAIDYGGGVDIGIKHTNQAKLAKSIRIEARNYQIFGSSAQHNVVMRVGLIGWLPD